MNAGLIIMVAFKQILINRPRILPVQYPLL